MAKKATPAGTKDINDPAKLHPIEEQIVPAPIGQNYVAEREGPTPIVHPPYPILGERLRLASLPLGHRNR